MRLLLLIAAIVCLVLAAVSAFSADVNFNEHGWQAVGLAFLAASFLPVPDRF